MNGTTTVWVTSSQEEEGCGHITLWLGDDVPGFLKAEEHVNLVRYEAEGLKVRSATRRTFEANHKPKEELHPVTVIDRWVRSATNLGIPIDPVVLLAFESILKAHLNITSDEREISHAEEKVSSRSIESESSIRANDTDAIPTKSAGSADGKEEGNKKKVRASRTGRGNDRTGKAPSRAGGKRKAGK